MINNIPNDFLREMSNYALIDGKRIRSCICLDIYLSSNQQIIDVKEKQGKIQHNHTLDIRNKIFEILDDFDEDCNLLDMCLQQKLLSENICKIIVMVELLHNVSLILDDLPSMDNDMYRRGKLSIHAKYN